MIHNQSVSVASKAETVQVTCNHTRTYWNYVTVNEDGYAKVVVDGNTFTPVPVLKNSIIEVTSSMDVMSPTGGVSEYGDPYVMLVTGSGSFLKC